MYDALAAVYDAWQSADGMTPFALVARARIAPELARERPEPRSFLDLGCGTGELLLSLRRAHPGWRLAGVDASAAMLAAAARKPGAAGVGWLRARLDAPLPIAGARFDAAGAFYDTLNHLPDMAALERALAAAAGALRPGGVLYFDVTNALGFDRWWRGRNRWVGVDWDLALEMRYDAAARVGHARVTVGRRGTATAFELRERWFTDGEIREALAAAGLTPEKSDPWSPFDIDAPGKTLWIARKTP
jgi:SAM-dependent methyltransferase